MNDGSPDRVALQAGLAAYAGRLHAAAGPGQHVVSPLGAWLLIALCAGPDEDRLAPVLGMDGSGAATVVGALLADPHPVVAAALGAWSSPPDLDDWSAGLPAGVATGPIPAQADLDA
jgi:hypothetical protein